MPRPADAYDRVFYAALAVALGLTVVAGFASTYYFKLISGAPKLTVNGVPFTALVHVHGALFTAWIVLFVVQTALVATRRVAVHRKLGAAGAVLAGAMVLAGLSVAFAAASRPPSEPDPDPLGFLIIPIFDMILFSTFVTIALIKRRDRESHKRLMVLAYVSISVAAIARIPGVSPLGPPAFFGFAFVVIVLAALYDLATRGRVHRAYLWGGAAFAISVPLRLAISASGGWHDLASALTR